MGSGRPDYRQGHDLEAQAIDRLSTISKAPAGTTPVFKSGLAAGGMSILHTVAAGKTFFLTAAALALSSLDTTRIGYVQVRDDNDIGQYYLLRMAVQATGGNSAHLAYALPQIPPLEIATGWDIIVYSPAGTLYSGASVSGWEE